MSILVPISIGELFDKISILTIKSELLKDKEALKNVKYELSTLSALAWSFVRSEKLDFLVKQLKNINKQMWNCEDMLRYFEELEQFDDQFITAARQVYVLNSKRSRIKREINTLLESRIVEEKSYG